MLSRLYNLTFKCNGPLNLGKGPKKVSTRDPIFGGSCVPKPLPLKDSNFTGVPQATQRIERAKIGGQ